MEQEKILETELEEFEKEIPQKNTVALVGFILSLSLGLLGVVLTVVLTLLIGMSIFFLPIFCYIPSFVLGIIGLKKAKKREGKGKKFSVFAIVLSIVFYLLSLGISLVPILISAGIFIVYLINVLLTTL